MLVSSPEPLTFEIIICSFFLGLGVTDAAPVDDSARVGEAEGTTGSSQMLNPSLPGIGSF